MPMQKWEVTNIIGHRIVCWLSADEKTGPEKSEPA